MRLCRLTDAWASGHHQTFGFATTSGCGTGNNANAGKNSDRTSFTDTAGSISYSYCYDSADRLMSTTTAGIGTLTYDTHGNTTTLGTTTLGYDGADRHTTTVAGSTNIRYVRDATGRIVERQLNGVTAERYSYTGDGDTPDATLDSGNNVVERTITLPGGVLLDKRLFGGDVWSYPNLHGDVAATANGSGTKTGATTNYDAFGNALNAVPDNIYGNTDYGWKGQYQKLTEHEPGAPVTIEMGARIYDPTLGRFLETDPIEGGSENDYAYPADPVNGSDLTGTYICHYANSRFVDEGPCDGSGIIRPAPVLVPSASTAPDVPR